MLRSLAITALCALLVGIVYLALPDIKRDLTIRSI